MSDHESPLDFSLHETDLVYSASGVVRDGPDVAAADWSAGAMLPFADLPISPAASVLSYGLGIFEGLKVQRTSDGRLLVFRLPDHAERFRRSATALLLPPFPAELFQAAVKELVRGNITHVPAPDQGSLYVRATQFADQGQLGLAACRRARVVMYGSPVGSYFDPDGDGIKLRLLDRSRVPAGGTGWAKAIGNYAGGLATRTEWAQQGFDDVLYVDARSFRFLAETSGANVFVRFTDGTVATPKLDDQILPGVTRDSVITLLQSEGITVQERDIDREEVYADAVEMFCTGTAWTVQSVARLDHEKQNRQFDSQDTRCWLGERLARIKSGEESELWGWCLEISG
ncbi:MAG: branched-chain amino acid aminotransferase [bacterium]